MAQEIPMKTTTLALLGLIALVGLYPTASAQTPLQVPAGCDATDLACGVIAIVPCDNAWEVTGVASAPVTWTLVGPAGGPLTSTGTTFRAAGPAQDPLNSNAVGLTLYANGHFVASDFALGCRTA